jgi:Lrp/AsnC family leucine-responsive transcriptional regulator
MPSDRAELDEVDRRILGLLQADCRIGFQELGQAVGLSGPAAFQRVRRLESRGAITGYHARVSPGLVGRGRVVFVRVTPGPASDVAKLVRQWSAVEDVLECHRVAADGALVLKLRLPDDVGLLPYLDAARGAGCSVHADVAVETAFERWRLPVT